MLNKKSQKIAKKYECLKCDYNTGNKSDYKKHLDTQKHYNSINDINATKKLGKCMNAINAVKNICINQVYLDIKKHAI
jgi:hypothetical protein